MTTTFTQQLRRDCLNPQLHLLLAYQPGETKPNFPLPASINGMNIQAGFLRWNTGEVKRQTVINLPAEAKIYLFASPWPDWYFIVQYSQYHRRFGCSCTQRFCEHVRFMQREVRS